MRLRSALPFSATCVFQSTHRTQTMRQGRGRKGVRARHFNPRIVRKRCDLAAVYLTFPQADISIHASYANDATHRLFLVLNMVVFQSTHRTHTMRRRPISQTNLLAIISIHASYANDATARGTGRSGYTPGFQSTHRTQTMRLS